MPREAPHNRHIYHVYSVRLKNRDQVLAALEAREVYCSSHYPLSIHLQKGYQNLGIPRGSLPMSENCASEFLSLPMFPELTGEAMEYVAKCLSESMSATQAML